MAHVYTPKVIIIGSEGATFVQECKEAKVLCLGIWCHFAHFRCFKSPESSSLWSQIEGNQRMEYMKRKDNSSSKYFYMTSNVLPLY